MILYHYTSIYHLVKIVQDGHIRTTESNASMDADHFANDVVWLTSNKNPQCETSLGGATDKKQVRITVNVPAIQYVHWAKRNHVPTDLMEMLNKQGGNQMPKWHVMERPITQQEWKKIDIFDYGINKWVPYSEETHKRILGKILVHEQDGKFIPVDSRSDLMFCALEYLGIDMAEFIEVIGQ